MLTSLFPYGYMRYTSLPILGDALEDLCSWLDAQGYPPSVIRRRIQGAPFLDKCLQLRSVKPLSSYTAAELRACMLATREAVYSANRFLARAVVADVSRRERLSGIGAAQVIGHLN
jgi:hypothetical protein